MPALQFDVFSVFTVVGASVGVNSFVVAFRWFHSSMKDKANAQEDKKKMTRHVTNCSCVSQPHDAGRTAIVPKKAVMTSSVLVVVFMSREMSLVGCLFCGWCVDLGLGNVAADVALTNG